MDFYATLGDPCAKRDVMDKLFQAGMTGLRVNLSHTSLVKCAPLLEEVYWPAARRAGRPDAHLILDLEGPELRVGELPRPISLREGEELLLGEGGVPVPPVQKALHRLGGEGDGVVGGVDEDAGHGSASFLL